MKKKCAAVLTTGVLLAGLAGTAEAGRIVVNHDDWTLDNTGFTMAPDAARFALNIAAWFTGGASAGNFLAYSTNHALTESVLASTMTNAGHGWTVSTSVDTSLANLLQYDGIYFAGNTFDSNVLIDYVEAGGNVYLAAGTTWTVGANAAACNPFLNHFGLNLATAINGVDGVLATSSDHDIFGGVESLYYVNGNFVNELNPADPHTDILEYYGADGMIGVYDSTVPLPGAVWLLASGIVGFLGLRRRIGR